MKVISIGTDKKILEGGRVFERVKEYASLIDGEYYAFIFGGEKVATPPSLQGKGTLGAEQRAGEGPVLDNFHPIGLGNKNKFSQIINLFSELRKLKLSKDDILYPQDVFEIGLISYIFSKIYKCKLYVQCHTDTSSENFRNESKRNYLQYLISKFVFKRADKIRVVSERMRKYLIEELNINENIILKLPIYFDSPHPTSPTRGGEVTQREFDFLIMSRIESVKNIEVAIEAIEIINRERKIKGEKELTLKIVGSGSYKKYLQQKYRTTSPFVGEVRWGITWSDWTENPMQEYQNAKYFLLPSFYEGWGMTAVESVANGTPVIMTNVGCAHEFILNNENGIISEGFDIPSFKDAIQKAIVIDWQSNDMQNTMKNSLKNLNNKQEYLEKLKKFLTE